MSPRRLVVALAAVVGLVALTLFSDVVGPAATARAAPVPPTPTADCSSYVASSTTVNYGCNTDGGVQSGGTGTLGSGGGGGGGGGQGPGCVLDGPPTFCQGLNACWYATPIPPYGLPTTPPPVPNAQWHLLMCRNVAGGIDVAAEWIDPQVPAAPAPPPLLVQAREAVGKLRLPSIQLVTNPPGRALVNLVTYFAPAGPPPGQLRGTSALGLIAIATQSHWTVNPGDGSAALSCTPTANLAAPGGCAHTYSRSSLTKPADASGYRVTAAATWGIRYEVNGAAVDIPGAPVVVNGPQSVLILPVAEVQALVATVG